MDPLGKDSSFKNIHDIPSWQSFDIPEYNLQDSALCEGPEHFPISPDINKALIVWNGDILKLKADAVVNILNATPSVEETPFFQIMCNGISEVSQEELMREIKQCRTGETKFTKGYSLPCRFVIHTISPRFNPKYQSAAENALFNSYRNSLLTVLDNKLSTIAIPPIHCSRLNYPVDQGAHIALRTIRRMLEKCEGAIENVLIQIPETYWETYIKIIPQYFPRNDKELEYSRRNLPIDIGNENGEPVCPERKIRISGHPFRRLSDLEDQSDSDISESEVTPNQNNSGILDDDELTPGLHAFARMEVNPDLKRKSMLNSVDDVPEAGNSIIEKRRYERWLRQANQMDLSSISNLHCIYPNGYDSNGRPIILLVGKYFISHLVDYQKLIMYFIRIMDKVVNNSYVLIYIHTDTTSKNYPHAEFIKNLYNLLDTRYKRNLHALYMLHPTWWTRFLFWLFTTFSANEVKSKIHRVNSLSELYRRVNPTQLDLPEFCYDYDRKMNQIQQIPRPRHGSSL